MTQLSQQTLERLPKNIGTPNYESADVDVGIVHFGIGAFHRAHQAVVTDRLLASGAKEWGIAAVNLRSAQPVEDLEAQDGYYSVVTRTDGDSQVEVIGSIIKWLCASREPDAVLDLLQSDSVKVVTMTVSEKAYGLNVATGGLDLNHPAIKADLESPRTPSGIIGYIVEGLERRRASGKAPFTVLCCDNLPSNGEIVRRLVLEMAGLRDQSLQDWIAENVAFPSSMVDRIVPAATEESKARAQELLGLEDRLSLDTETFLQWVIEDDFRNGRPDWTKGGALFVDHVAPYEDMKLRLLNGSHTLIAHLGILQGLECVRDVMAIPENVVLVRRHMQAAAATLEPVPGIEIAQYIDQLIARFSNKAIAHRCVQIAMDTSQKLPQRILAPAEVALAKGADTLSFAYVIALWAASILKRGELDDPRAEEILNAVTSAKGDSAASAIFEISDFVPDTLQGSKEFRQSVDVQFAEIARNYLSSI